MEIDEYRRSWWPWMLLVLLFLAYNISVLDRMIIGLMIEPIKASMNISDTQISFVNGFAFLIMYSLAGPPLGLLADRIARQRLVAAGLAFWSLMTAFCGFANAYGALFLARVGVGIGEATLAPATHSMIANAFPPKRLGLVFGFVSLGGITGVGLSLILGGYLLKWLTSVAPISVPVLGSIEPWQAAFIIVSLPGLVLAPIFLFVRDPPRERPTLPVGKGARLTGLRNFYRTHWKAILPHHLAIGFSNMLILGSLTWVAPFFARVHGWPIERIGLWVGVANMVAGLVGLLAGGALSDTLSRYGVRGRLLLCLAVMPVAAAAGLFYPVVDSTLATILLFTVFLTTCLLPYGVAGAILQTIAPDQSRGILAAVFLLVVSLVSSAGPTMVAVLSDQVFVQPSGIRYALQYFAVGGALLSALMFLLAIKPFMRAAATIEGERETVARSISPSVATPGRNAARSVLGT